jgi:coenzyme F420 hydrogenase subunit beta
VKNGKINGFEKRKCEVIMKVEQRMPLERIWNNGYCVGCGACAAICPKQIIRLEFVEKIGLYKAGISSDNRDQCDSCNLCFQVCPAVSRDKQSAGQSVKAASRSDLLDWLIGPYRKIYTGHAADSNIRYMCSSGGVATAVLLHLFKTKSIHGALIACPIPDKPIKHRVYLVKRIEGIISHSGTIYCQIDYSQVWKFIQNSQGQLAILGQPCYLKAVDSFIDAKKLDGLRIFKIGLFCGGTSNHRVLEYLCKRKKVNPEEVLSIQYRSGGWPGRKMVVTVLEPTSSTGTKEVILFDREASLLENYLYRFCFSGAFFPKFCLACRDQTAEHADISLGDAWLSRFTSWDRAGTNIVIARTLRAQELIEDAGSKNAIEWEEAKSEDVINSQGNCLAGRKLGLWGKHIMNDFVRVSELMVSNRYIPQYIPGRRLLAERRVFRWLATNLPTSVAYGAFVFYNLAINFLAKFMKAATKVMKGKK